MKGKLEKIVINGKFLDIIDAIKKGTKYFIFIQKKVTDPFYTTIGLKQVAN